jgi:hypothetical protein
VQIIFKKFIIYTLFGVENIVDDSGSYPKSFVISPYGFDGD